MPSHSALWSRISNTTSGLIEYSDMRGFHVTEDATSIPASQSARAGPLSVAVLTEPKSAARTRSRWEPGIAANVRESLSSFRIRAARSPALNASSEKPTPKANAKPMSRSAEPGCSTSMALASSTTAMTEPNPSSESTDIAALTFSLTSFQALLSMASPFKRRSHMGFILALAFVFIIGACWGVRK
nr:MAG TPA: hypothetical protein [Caudoviricetes sp.]